MSKGIRKQTSSIVFILLTIYCQHFQLTYSASIGIRYLLTTEFKLVLLNMLIIAIPLSIVLLVLRKVATSILITDILITVLSIINYHVYLFHGTPFLASDFRNITTAFDVMDAYNLVLDKIVIRLLLISFVELLILLMFYKRVKDQQISFKINLFAIVADCLVLWFLFFSSWTIFPNSLVSWSWAKPMAKYGYEVCFVNSVYCTRKIVNTIEGYDPKLLAKYLHEEETKTEADTDYPDIILILNESLGDLDYCSGIQEGSEALQPIRNIKEIVSGYTVVPLVGGGTNCSEYELLTSNSMYEISAASPFAVIDLSEADSIVRYLKTLGYHSAAMHCYSEENYARNAAYPALGFDEIYLGEDHFTFASHGNREWLDQNNYEDLLRIYNHMEDSPRFMYLLTFQNHGGYKQNDPEWDSVHISNDLGQYTDEVEEYLTSIKSCAEGFRYLIDEFSDSDRPVIVLMVGDHEPSFISELPVSSIGYPSSVIQRTVPYYVWSNKELNNEVFSEITSLTDLVPMLLNSEDMPLSPYYQLINKLHLTVPVRTSDGMYFDADGNKISTQTDEEKSNMIRDYYYMEYNSITRGEDYMAKLFDPY